MTTYYDATQLTSTWPAGVEFNSSESVFLYSVSNTHFINPLDHLGIIAIDEPQVPPGNPNVMTLDLPNINALPFASRLYFFYVSQANEGDELFFNPVPGSGNTVNGNALGFSFTLTGNRQLFIAIAFNDNYIIHNFGANEITPPPPPPISNILTPGVISTLKSQNLANPIPKVNYYAGDGAGVSSYFPNGATAMNDLTPFGSYDISSHFIPNVPVTASPPQTDVRGFKVLVGGYYDIKLSMIATLTYGQQRFIQSVDLAIFNGAGTLKKIFREHRNTAQQASTYQISTISSVIWKLDVDDVVVYSYTAQQDNLQSTAYIEATVSFVYYGPEYEPPAEESGPLLFASQLSRTAASTIPEESLTSTEKEAISLPVHKSITKGARQQIISIQKKYKSAAEAAMRASSSSSSSSSGTGSSAGGFTLADIENIIGKAISAREQQQQQQQQRPSRSLSLQEPVLSSTPSKKRKLSVMSSKEKESEIL